jgi:hypothetical protein
MQGFEFQKYFDCLPYIKKHFCGVFSINTLPKQIKYRQFCICNTDTSEGSGQHWFCFVRNSKSEIECFDSLGINEEKKQLLRKYCVFRGIKEINFNQTTFQNSETDTCGLFTIYFIVERMFNLDLTFEEVLEEIFDENTLINEEKVSKFCNNILQT